MLSCVTSSRGVMLDMIFFRWNKTIFFISLILHQINWAHKTAESKRNKTEEFMQIFTNKIENLIEINVFYDCALGRENARINLKSINVVLSGNTPHFCIYRESISESIERGTRTYIFISHDS